MSREIDMTAPETWSDEDIQYLKERCRIPDDWSPESAPSPPVKPPENDSQDADDGEGDDDSTSKYDEWRKDRLVKACESRDLEIEGTRAELISRLVEADKADEED